MSNQDTLSKAAKQLMLKEPFYGLFLLMLNKTWRTAGIPTAGVSKNGINFQLAINPFFWESLTEEWQWGILKHELLHIAFHHLTMSDRFSNQELANIAMDIEINQHIDKTWLPAASMSAEEFKEEWEPKREKLFKDFAAGDIKEEDLVAALRKIPPRGCYIEDFAHLNLEPKKGAKYYYDKLQDHVDNDPACQAALAAMAAGIPEDGDGNSVPGSGHPSAHPTWGEFEGLTEADQKLIQTQTDFHLREIAEQITKSRGTIPGELAGYIDGLMKEEPPKFNWKGYLRRFTGGSVKVFTKKTRRKYNKRYPDMPGMKIKPKKHILVGVDTSGSVSKKELKEFFHEIYHMHKTGAEVTVTQCDAAISDVSPLDKASFDKIAIHGRGGTSFQPVVDYYNEHSREFSCLIYLTDGEAPAPTSAVGSKILWVLSTESEMNDDLPGAVIKLN